MVNIEFSGETLHDVATQARNFANVVFAGAGQVAAAEKPASRPSVKAPKASDKATGKSEAEIASELPGETIVEPGTEALKKTKEDALDILRKVYSTGPTGQKAVKKITSDYGVKKAGDIPVEKAVELLKAAKAAQVKTENAPI